MVNTIKCQECGADIEITSALTHQIEEQVIKSLELKHKQEIEETKKKIEQDATLTAEKAIELKFNDLKKEKEEDKQKNINLTEQIKNLLDNLRELRRKDEDRELETKRKIMEEEGKIREEATKKAEEKNRLDNKEKDKIIDDLKISLEEAQRKANSKSQQLQGEVLELDVEERLKSLFPHDQIDPIAKGVAGADILQKVKNSFSQMAGSILWETKRAKWNSSWITKLKEDSRKIGASVGVLVSEELPKNIQALDTSDGIIIITNIFVLPLAGILRKHLMQLAGAKSAVANKDVKLERLFGYLQSESFRYVIETQAEVIVEMQGDLNTEKISMQRIWKKREAQINNGLEGLAKMYGELQGIMGAALPDIKIFTLPSGSENKDENQGGED